jgi:hypothetical protein
MNTKVNAAFFRTSADIKVITKDIRTIDVVIIRFFLNITRICLKRPTRNAEPIRLTRIDKEKHIANGPGLP